MTKSEIGAYASLIENGHTLELPKDLITLFVQERAYQSAATKYDNYINWKNTRNPKRAELESRFGYDTKHASHLVRLMRMCEEILTTGMVFVKRPDREEILAIKRGEWSYDRLIEYAELMQAKVDSLYETSKLRREPNRSKIDKIIVDITDRYLRKHG